MGIHDGHRARLKHRFIEQGLYGFDDHTALELLLFYALPRSDTNPLAHRLLASFGTLDGVFDAPIEDLVKIPGISENSAVLIKLIPQLSRRYALSRSAFDNIIDTTQKAGDYLIPFFLSERDEVIYLLCLDAKNKVISCRLVARGSVNNAGVSIRKIVETALMYNATGVILAHNHTSGIAVPSKDDETATLRVRDALAVVDIQLIDHIVVAEDDFVSLADNGVI